MKRRFRLRSSKSIRQIRKTGRTFASNYLVLIKQENQSISPKCAVIVNRSIGGAVARNQVKRILRAILNEFVTEIHAGYDLLLIARKPMLTANYAQAKESLYYLMVKANLLKETTHVG